MVFLCSPIITQSAATYHRIYLREVAFWVTLTIKWLQVVWQRSITGWIRENLDPRPTWLHSYSCPTSLLSTSLKKSGWHEISPFATKADIKMTVLLKLLKCYDHRRVIGLPQTCHAQLPHWNIGVISHTLHSIGKAVTVVKPNRSLV